MCCVARPAMLDTSDPRPQPEPRKFEDGGKGRTGGADGRWVGFTLRLVGCANPSHSKRVGLESPQEDLHARSYEHYRKAVDKYDRNSTRDYLKDLGAMLIYVSLAYCSEARVLTWMTDPPSTSLHPWLASYGSIRHCRNVRLPSPPLHVARSPREIPLFKNVLLYRQT